MITLTDGLADISKELGENSANQTTNRIKHYNDAVQAFALEKKWPFLVKRNTTILTVANQAAYSISGITDIREPGGIKEILIGDDAADNPPYIPVDYEQRYNPDYAGKKFFYKDDELNKIVFLSAPTKTGLAISIRYFYIPARIETTSSTEKFPIPDPFRKVIATLAAAYVQWGRYLDAQGNRLFNMYERLLTKSMTQQSERNKNNPRKIEHPLRWRGFRRSYPPRV